MRRLLALQWSQSKTTSSGVMVTNVDARPIALAGMFDRHGNRIKIRTKQRRLG
jgi:hypothetical protein